jgi:phage shock protein PspC (stress-responsive transcriptional regulator)
MKKTNYINLSGMAFKIEEDAYERLSAYLDDIEAHLEQEEEASETLTDIETRIAELFSAVLLSSDNAVTITEVEDVIKTLGKPEDFVSQENAEKPKNQKRGSWRSRRLYRDPNNRIIGGVCSGLGTYFNVDPVLFRIIFVIGLLSGISPIPYILLWIIVPKAKTIEQRAMMTAGYDASTSRKRTASQNRQQSDNYKLNLKPLKTFLGILIIIGVIFMLFAFTIVFFVIQFNYGSDIYVIWTREITGLFLDGNTAIYALTGIGLVILIPVIMLLYAGLSLIFSFVRGGRLLSLTGLFLWLVGIGLVIFASINTARHFTEKTIVTQTDILETVESDKIFLKKAPSEQFSNKLFNVNVNDMKIYIHDKKIEKDNKKTVYVNKQLIVEGRPVINIIKNADQFSITVEKESLGPDITEAEANALNIEYFWVQKENEILLDRIFTLAEGAIIRGQKLTVKVEIPDNYYIDIDPAIKALVRIY